MDFNKSPESKESLPKLLFKVTLMRHEKPFYKDEGHDLTPEGVEGAMKFGKKLKEEGIIDENDEVILAHSPAVRAKGTLDFVAQSAGLEDKPKISLDQLRRSDIPNMDIFMDHVINELGSDQEKVAEDHYKNPIHEDRPDFIEPMSQKKDRLYRAFEYMIRQFEKYPSEGKKPHVIAVSHFEIVTHLINDVFGIENIGRYNAPAFGEAVFIEAYETGDEDKVKLKVTFDNQTKEVYFDRRTRSIELI